MPANGLALAVPKKSSQVERLPGTRSIATRITNAENAFASMLQKRAGLTKDQSFHVLDVYRRYKIVKLDMVGGVYNVKHGRFLDLDVIKNAVNERI